MEPPCIVWAIIGSTSWVKWMVKAEVMVINGGDDEDDDDDGG